MRMQREAKYGKTRSSLPTRHFVPNATSAGISLHAKGRLCLELESGHVAF